MCLLYLSLYTDVSNYRIKRLLSGVRYAFYHGLTCERSAFRAADQLKNSTICSAFLFYREACCYFQEAELFHYIFLKTCAVMCEVIQLVY